MATDILNPWHSLYGHLATADKEPDNKTVDMSASLIKTAKVLKVPQDHPSNFMLSHNKN
jgi:hypothetical protein